MKAVFEILAASDGVVAMGAEGRLEHWRETGLSETINHLLVTADRDRAGHGRRPRARQPERQDDRELRPERIQGWQEGKRRKRQVTVGWGARG